VLPALPRHALGGGGLLGCGSEGWAKADSVSRTSSAASSAGRQARRRVLPASGAGSGVRPNAARVQLVQGAALEGDRGECSFSG